MKSARRGGAQGDGGTPGREAAAAAALVMPFEHLNRIHSINKHEEGDREREEQHTDTFNPLPPSS